MAPQPHVQRSANKWSARLVPLFIVGIVGYVTWVNIALLAVNHLLHPPSDVPKRTGAGIAVIVVYFLTFVLMSASYARIIHIVYTNPGYVPLPREQRRKQSRRRSSRSSRTDTNHDEKLDDAMSKGYLDRTAVLDGKARPPPGLEEFYSRDVFECDIDGLPRWCSSCKNWKPDRSHHSSEMGRCVYKLDHFCPWAGGLVSETNFKFFVQFCVYAFLYCLSMLIFLAYFLQKGQLNQLQRVTFIIAIALSALFLLFSMGMAINSLNFAFMNTTTIDNLARTRSQHLAVYSSQLSTPEASGYETFERFSTVTFPLPSSSSGPYPRRTFAILSTPSGKCPYQLSRLANFRQIMGFHWYDWFVPFRQSPSSDHGFSSRDDEAAIGDSRVMYPVNDVIKKMRKDAGIDEAGKHKKRRRSHRYSSSGGGRSSRSTNERRSSRSSRSEDFSGRSPTTPSDGRSSRVSHTHDNAKRNPKEEEEAQSEKSGEPASSEDPEEYPPKESRSPPL